MRHDITRHRTAWIFMVILIASTGFAELRESRSDRSASAENQADLTLSFTAIGYLGELSYHNTTAKDLSLIQGIYLAAAWGEEHLLEAEFDSLEISFRYPWTLNQQDITLAYANYSIPNLKLRAGGHFLGGDDEATSDGRALFAGTRYYVPYNLEGYYVQYSWDIGLEGCVSSYPHYTNGLSVCQLTLSHGFNLCHGDGWYCRNEAKAYWIHTGENPGLGKSDFLSAEERISLYWWPYSIAIYGWNGEQVFSVKNDGFALYNLADIHRAGYGLECGFSFSEVYTTMFRLGREEYEETGRDVMSYADQFLFMVRIKW